MSGPTRHDQPGVRELITDAAVLGSESHDHAARSGQCVVQLLAWKVTDQCADLVSAPRDHGVIVFPYAVRQRPERDDQRV